MDEGSAIAKLIWLLTPTTKLARAVLVALRETFFQAHDCAAPEKDTGKLYEENLAQNKNRLVSCCDHPKIPEQLPVGSSSGTQPVQDNSG